MFLDTRLMIVGVYVRDLRQGTLGEVVWRKFVQLDLLNGSLPIWVRVGGPSNVSFCNNFHIFSQFYDVNCLTKYGIEAPMIVLWFYNSDYPWYRRHSLPDQLQQLMAAIIEKLCSRLKHSKPV